MIITEAYFDGGALIDVRITGIKEGFIVASDFNKIEDAVLNYETDLLLSDNWYRFELLPKYEDDGSGAKVLDWFEIIAVEFITETGE